MLVKTKKTQGDFIVCESHHKWRVEAPSLWGCRAIYPQKFGTQKEAWAFAHDLWDKVCSCTDKRGRFVFPDTGKRNLACSGPEQGTKKGGPRKGVAHV
jgi:hypothetical protein